MFNLRTFSSPEPTILLACGRDRELWRDPIFWACAEYSFRILNQSDLLDLTISPRIAEFRCWTKPELSIPATGQKDRGLWGREWSKNYLSCMKFAISFPIGQKRTLNFRNQRLWLHLAADYVTLRLRTIAPTATEWANSNLFILTTDKWFKSLKYGIPTSLIQFFSENETRREPRPSSRLVKIYCCANSGKIRLWATRVIYKTRIAQFGLQRTVITTVFFNVVIG